MQPQSCQLVFFDLETSGRNRKVCEILQIAATANKSAFSTYVQPTMAIQEDASKVNGITIAGNTMYFNKKTVESVSISDALQAFSQFLRSFSTPCILVAHNASFDISFLLREVHKNSMINDYAKIIYGFVDSLKILKKKFTERPREKGMFTLKKLADDFLTLDAGDENFHEGLFDCKILQNLIAKTHLYQECYQQENIQIFKDSMLDVISGRKKVEY